MRSLILCGLGLMVACDLSLTGATCLAQQVTGSGSQGYVNTSRARATYYTRVQTQGGAAGQGASYRYRAPVGSSASLSSYGSSDDPLRAYGHESASTAGTQARPYERAPVVSPPQRQSPSPAVSHNYFPGFRPGQGPNRNTVQPHCVPGRHAFLR